MTLGSFDAEIDFRKVIMILSTHSTRITSKYLYIPSWLIQYELSLQAEDQQNAHDAPIEVLQQHQLQHQKSPTHTLRLPHLLPTLSSAVAFSPRWGLIWLTPCRTGLPYVAPLGAGLFLFPLLTRIR